MILHLSTLDCDRFYVYRVNESPLQTNFQENQVLCRSQDPAEMRFIPKWTIFAHVLKSQDQRQDKTGPTQSFWQPKCLGMIISS